MNKRRIIAAGMCLGVLAALFVPRSGTMRGDDREDCPPAIAPWAKPSNTPAYQGYYVGGGAPVRGEGRYASEGVWGWDYIGWRFNRRVALHWWHGEKYQGGSGAYKIDGPKILGEH